MAQNVHEYGRMIKDSIRTGAYAHALRQAVKPGAVVLDIGAGTGIFSLLACQFGARHVYAVEVESGLLGLTRESAAANGHADRLTTIRGFSTQVDLPEPADVIVSDIRDILPLYKRHIPTIADARARLLASGGVLIPQYDTLWVTVITAGELYQRFTTPWETNDYQLNMQAGRRFVINRYHRIRIQPDQMLCAPQRWATLDYRTVTNPNVSGRLEFTATQAGIGHGLGIWFDTELIEGVGFSNHPNEPELIYGHTFFPWEQPVEINPGDNITVTLQAHLVDDDYIWQWSTHVQNQGNSASPKATFSQSSFAGVLLEPDVLRKRSTDFVPRLNVQGQIDYLILGLMVQQKPLDEIVSELIRQHPERFSDWRDAFRRVADISEAYGQ